MCNQERYPACTRELLVGCTESEVGVAVRQVAPGAEERSRRAAVQRAGPRAAGVRSG